MRVLVACEFSGVVRRAFHERGHDVFSCDLLPAEDKSPLHFVIDVQKLLLPNQWDLMIAHPPCTYLCNSGVRWLYQGGRGKLKNKKRWACMWGARNFFNMLRNAPIARICIENPIPHRHAQLPPYSQIIQPWEYGHGETKATCLWLKGLPPLTPTNIVKDRSPRVHHASPGPDRWKERSRTLTGIAAAMAEQWD
jgi:hypothetical protein